MTEISSAVALPRARVAMLRVFAHAGRYRATLTFDRGTTVPIVFTTEPLCLLEAHEMASYACDRFSSGTN